MTAGRPRKLTPEQAAQVMGRKLRYGEVRDKARQFGVSRSTLDNYRNGAKHLKGAT